MLRSIDRTHVLLLPNLYFGTGNIRLADLRILRALEAVEQVCTEGTIKVNGEPRNDGRKDEVRVTQAMSKTPVRRLSLDTRKVTCLVCLPIFATCSLNSWRISTTFGVRGSGTSYVHNTMGGDTTKRATEMGSRYAQLVRETHISNRRKTCLVIFRDSLPIVNEEHFEHLRHIQLHLRLSTVFVLPHHAYQSANMKTTTCGSLKTVKRETSMPNSQSE